MPLTLQEFESLNIRNMPIIMDLPARNVSNLFNILYPTNAGKVNNHRNIRNRIGHNCSVRTKKDLIIARMRNVNVKKRTKEAHERPRVGFRAVPSIMFYDQSRRPNESRVNVKKLISAIRNRKRRDTRGVGGYFYEKKKEPCSRNALIRQRWSDEFNGKNIVE